MPTVTVNNQPVEIDASERLNCIQVAKRAGVEIPHYCWHPSLSVVASCRMCLVEVGDKKPDGTIAWQPKLVPGCQTPVKDGSVVVCDSPKVKQAQAATLEYLLLNHPLDCPVCDQAGECGLQDFSYKYGRGYSRLQEPKNLKPDKNYIGDQITLFTDRCIMCTRCVRFTREISGTAELQVTSRGTHEEIDIFPGEPCNNKLAGNVVDLCPVGALCSKDFLYEQRVWWLQSKKSVCPGCSTGCSITVDQNRDQLYRLKPRENPQAQGHFMCDEGRFGWKYEHSEARLTAPVERRTSGVASNDWSQVMTSARTAILDRLKTNSSRFAAVLSPWLTVEEAYLLAGWIKDEAPGATLALGPVRTVGEDDHYPKTVTGQAPAQVKFTIRAEKCPNRRGVEAVLRHFAGQVTTLDQLAPQLGSSIDAVYLAGGDPQAPWSAEAANQFSGVKFLVVQDCLRTPVSERAQFVLSGGTWAERDGTFVNHAGLAQNISRALRGPADAWPDGRILWELTGRTGLFSAPAVRQEIARTIPEFAALGVGKLGDHGVRLATEAAMAGSGAR